MVGIGLVSKHFTVRAATPVVFGECDKYKLDLSIGRTIG